jgi:hypothetical protein
MTLSLKAYGGPFVLTGRLHFRTFLIVVTFEILDLLRCWTFCIARSFALPGLSFFMLPDLLLCQTFRVSCCQIFCVADFLRCLTFYVVEPFALPSLLRFQGFSVAGPIALLDLLHWQFTHNHSEKSEDIIRILKEVTHGLQFVWIRENLFATED